MRASVSDRHLINMYIYKIASMMWNKPDVLGPLPSPRRAHTSIVWQDKLYIFGGGGADCALNDLHALDLDAMTWTHIDTKGKKPPPRGYHTATLVKDHLVIFGGSDGHDTFDDIHVLNMGKKFIVDSLRI